MPRANTRERGLWAEGLAEDHLRAQGLQPITRNFRCRFGEIDLIMRDSDILVFVEVRYRRSTNFGDGADSVDVRKQRRLLRTAEYYMQRIDGTEDVVCRFDIVSITTTSSGNQTQWITNAFGA